MGKQGTWWEKAIGHAWNLAEKASELPRRHMVKNVQSAYRKLHPDPSPFFYPEQRHEYIFKKVAKQNLYVHTEDDVVLTITRKHPREQTENLCPVLCLPGLAETRFVLDQALGRSFVDYLALNGFDVYMAELRGHGKSRHLKERYNWNVQTFLDFDVPAFLNKVTEISGSDKVLWVGHSMGGMLYYAYLINAALNRDNPAFDASLVKAGVTIGSPITFDQPSLMLFSLLYKGTFLNRLKFLPTESLSDLLSIIGFALDSPLTTHFWNYRNMELDNKILYLKDGLDNISQGVMRDFIESILTGDFRSSDGKINYRENLFLVNTPTLIVGGMEDRMAGPEGLNTIYHNLGSMDKELRIFGLKGYLRRGQSLVNMKDHSDYGHVDLTLGIHSKEEVWPYMLNWLRRHAKKDGDTNQMP